MSESKYEIGFRLHGARVAAGLIFLVDAARLMDVHQVTLRHAETGRRPADPELIRRATALFDVGEAFLLQGVATTERELLADRLAAAIESAKGHDSARIRDGGNARVTSGRYDELRHRLIEMRKAAGYATASAAAGAYGWNRSQYWQHEQGLYDIPRDRLIGYALTMGARPEWALTGQGPMHEEHPVPWQQQERVQRLPAGGMTR